VILGLDIRPPANESMKTYLNSLLLAGIALTISSVQGRVSNVMNDITRKILEPI
jgi:hypothetical protein